MTSPSLREQAARIIDPWAFKQCELAIEQGDDDVLRRFLPARELALARADLILALPQPPLSEGQDLESARDHAPTTCAAPVASDVAGQQLPGDE